MKNNQELFFNHIKQLFLQNSNLDITPDIIYGELSIFNIEKDKIVRLNSESLVGIQVSMANKYRNNKSVNTFSNGYYWVIENRGKLNDYSFYKELEKGIKLYIPVELSNINQFVLNIFEFILKENIIMQAKISKDIRNDTFVIRVRNKIDTEKIINYINDNIKYTSKIKVNPFILSIDNIGIAIEGQLSYNYIFAKLLSNYLNEKKKILEEVTLSSFKLWLNKQLQLFKNNSNILKKYDIKSKEELNDLILIIDILLLNLDNTITKDIIYTKQEDKFKDQTKDELFNNHNNILFIVNNLANKYGVEQAHKRIMKYINKEVGTNIFPRENNIRSIITKYFSPEVMKVLLESIGYDALLGAIKETTKKHSIKQTKYAILRLLNENSIDGFTNNNDVRSCLGLIIPRELLLEDIKDKLNSKMLEYSSDNIINMLLEDTKIKINN